MSDFQKNFLIPSKATIIFASEKDIEKWEIHFAEFNATASKPLNITLLNSSDAYDDTNWEDVLFSDIVLCNIEFEKLIPKVKKLAFHCSRSFPKDFFLQRKGKKSDNIEPSSLLHMKSKIQDFDQWFTRKGSVDIQGIYWHRVIFDKFFQRKVFQVASDWKWILCKESDSLESLVEPFLGMYLENFECLNIANNFFRSLSAEKTMIAPIVLTSDINQPRNNDEVESEASKSSIRNRKGKSIIREKIPLPIVNKTKKSTPGSSKKSTPRSSKKSTPGSSKKSTPGSSKKADDSASESLTSTSNITEPIALDHAPDSPILIQAIAADVNGLSQLTSMGFSDVDKCREALNRYDGDLERAVNFMLS
jgi:hypothetical protein